MKYEYVNRKGTANQKACLRCGTCCKKGGPILHKEDKKILLEGHAGHQHLMTIRKGEMTINPLSDTMQPSPVELIKVLGNNGEWTCLFYDADKSACKLYKNRFLECRLLKCWDIEDFLKIFGKRTLVRSDLINARDAILDVIKDHETICPASEAERLISYILRGKDKERSKKNLVDLVKKDTQIRSFAMHELGMKSEFERFIFGRPLTDLIQIRGLSFKFPYSTIK